MANHDVVIIGGGPGGYVAAIRAAQLGLNAAVIEKDRLGGVCLNWGCIPTKALLFGADLLGLFRRSEQFGIVHADLRADLSRAIDRSREVAERMVKGVEFLLRKNRVTVVPGTAVLKSRNEVAVEPMQQVLSAENVIIATGGVARSLPGVEIDGNAVITSREALELRRLPASIVIVGGGPIGVEFGYLYRMYGSEVTLIEMLDHLLPSEDEEVSALLERSFKQQGIRYLTRAGVQGIRPAKGKVRVGVNVDGRDSELEAEKVLMAVGVAANSDGLGLEALGVGRENGFIKVDGAMRTNVPGIYAIGDVTGKPMLAHVAFEQGVVAAERIAGLEPPEPEYETMPRCTYCQPQVASCGLTEAQARERGYDVRTGRFPFRANGKAAAAGADQGFVKVVMDADHGRLLGFHIIGPEATELIAEATLGLRAEGTADDVISTAHAHPTLSETIKEATLLAEGKGIHFFSEPARGEQR
jgi:dihydrolipoamide dehydrogenase